MGIKGQKKRIKAGSLIGLMMESNLSEGNQPFPRPAAELRCGVSITDAW